MSEIGQNLEEILFEYKSEIRKYVYQNYIEGGWKNNDINREDLSSYKRECELDNNIYI